MISLDNLKEGVPTVPPRFQGYFHDLAQTRPDVSQEAVQERQHQFEKAYEQIFQPSQQENAHVLSFVMATSFDI